jgi:Domain of unknown function DUF11/Bacterial lectin
VDGRFEGIELSLERNGEETVVGSATGIFPGPAVVVVHDRATTTTVRGTFTMFVAGGSLTGVINVRLLGRGALRSESGTATITGGAGELRGARSTSAALYEAALPFTAGLDVTFNFFDYNTIPTFVSTGADGVSFFLADGSKPLVTPGGFGGSLGYAQTTDPFLVDGILGGYLGVGFDEFGNFGNNTEGRGAGCNQPDNGFYPNYVTLRGPGSGQSGHCILDRVNVAGYGAIDAPAAKSRTAPDVKRTVHIVVDSPSQPGAHILVQMNFGSGSQTVMDAPEPPNPPPTFKFGFAASTGGANNIHEINATQIDTILPVPRLVIAKTDTGPFVAGGTGTFTLTPSTQAGSDVGPELQPVTVTDTLPAGTLNGAPTGTGWDCSASSGTRVSCTYPASASSPIPAGTTLPPITVPVVFGPDESAIFTNTAEVSSQDNANDPEDRSASDTFHVLPIGGDDFGTTTVGVPVGVPILDNDHGSLQPSSVIITGQPANGTAAWNVNTQEAIYTPNPGWSGIDTHREGARPSPLHLAATPLGSATTAAHRTPNEKHGHRQRQGGAATGREPMATNPNPHTQGESNFDRRKGVNFRAALTVRRASRAPAGATRPGDPFPAAIEGHPPRAGGGSSEPGARNCQPITINSWPPRFVQQPLYACSISQTPSPGLDLAS